jgi:hypothetical protein
MGCGIRGGGGGCRSGCPGGCCWWSCVRVVCGLWGGSGDWDHGGRREVQCTANVHRTKERGVAVVPEGGGMGGGGSSRAKGQLSWARSRWELGAGRKDEGVLLCVLRGRVVYCFRCRRQPRIERSARRGRSGQDGGDDLATIAIAWWPARVLVTGGFWYWRAMPASVIEADKCSGKDDLPPCSWTVRRVVG